MEGEGQKADNSNLPTPSTEIREDLVETAVKFLQNSKVRQSAFSQRRGFLVRKGLTEAEIAEAIKRSGTASDETSPQPAVSAPANTTVIVPQTVAPPPAPVTRTPWETLRDILNLATFIGGAIYALYYFYKRFVMKWLFGKSSSAEDSSSSSLVKSKEVDRVEEQLVVVTASISELKLLVTQTNEHVRSFVGNSARERGDTELGRMGVTEIKDEIKSLKSLMLSKKQFPPIPSASPVLPTWQLRGAAANKSVKDSNTTATVGDTVTNGNELKQSPEVSASTTSNASSSASESSALDVLVSAKLSADVVDGKVAAGLGSGDQNGAGGGASETVDEEVTLVACQENEDQVESGTQSIIPGEEKNLQSKTSSVLDSIRDANSLAIEHSNLNNSVTDNANANQPSKYNDSKGESGDISADIESSVVARLSSGSVSSGSVSSGSVSSGSVSSGSVSSGSVSSGSVSSGSVSSGSVSSVPVSSGSVSSGSVSSGSVSSGSVSSGSVSVEHTELLKVSALPLQLVIPETG